MEQTEEGSSVSLCFLQFQGQWLTQHFFHFTITWDQPVEPNGVIITYEVSYKQTDSFTRLNTTNQGTGFSTQSNL